MDFKDLLVKLGRQKIMVVGDLILDKFQYGEVDRISPEAPIPVVLFKEEKESPGGAANVLKNLSGLKIPTLLFGTVGNDSEAAHLKRLLSTLAPVDVSGVVVDPDRRTTTKYRIIGNHQQIVRIDHEDVKPLSEKIFDQLRARISDRINEVSAVIISDYGKGVITKQLIRFVLGLKRKHKVLVSVDPKTGHFFYYKGVDLITPNNKEASEASGIKIKDENTLKAAALRIRSKLKCGNLLVTRSAEGMSLFNDDHPGGRHFPTQAVEVYDVSGAGDTVISVMTAGLAAGITPEKAAQFANFAAGIVVGETGTTAINIEKLHRAGLKKL